ncbi:hypothetical protein EDB81DRAFT_89512 [Dactylonectria macrodidyma]|uniref:Long-chain-alcohol oxidase n=1 Tax=Dactylonectria macrodidyma TaxID=307937 RepID=A0A9P9EBC2_9HYPO|nr:hypothetical protein EDB81DRAFT_89512 [Dactylonectria macrodidyma]
MSVISALVPLDAPLAPFSTVEDLNQSQWDTLLSICDAIIPSIQASRPAEFTGNPDASTKHDFNDHNAVVTSASPRQKNLTPEYLHETPSTIPAFRQVLRRILLVEIPASNRNQLLGVLSFLGYPTISALLTGRTTIISEQPVHIREEILLNWATSRFGTLRVLHRQLALMVKEVWVRTTPTLRPIVGFPRVPVNSLLGEGHPFSFIQVPPGEDEEVLETDVVIVGSGCGGGVCAKELTEAGLRVIVVDKGRYWSPEYLPMTEENGPSQMLMDGAHIASDDASVCVVAGETWGGGGAINWSASLQLQGYVRRQWAATGLPLFTTTAFQRSLDRVCDTMGVSTKHIQHSKPNQFLLEGSRKLGWAHAEVPQNTGGKEHSCGHCSMGCRSAEKQGPAVAWLPKAAAAGATFMEGFTVDRVLFENVRGNKVAKGVCGVWKSRDEHGGVAGNPTTTRKVTIRAKKVIVSCGTLQSPLLLLRSGLNNPHIGRHLYLHPVSMVGAIYDEQTRPWDGPILSSVCSEFENLDGHGHGVKLETLSTIPWSWLTWVPWTGGQQFKQVAANLDHMAGFISVPRDRDTGRVYPDPVDGRCRVQYHPSNFDKQSILEGLAALARISYESGAREIFTIVPGMDNYVRRDDAESIKASDVTAADETTDPEFEHWITKLRSHGFPAPQTFFVSAHQMGTCRMSATPKRGVVGPDGQVWGTEGLYVADASVFPTASGVNPAVTVMAIADHLSRSIAAKWTRERL